MLQVNHSAVEDIIRDLISTEEPAYAGLLGGSPGKILLYAYWYLLTKDEAVINPMQETLEDNIATLNSSNPNCSFGYGLAGFAWLLQELSDIGLIDVFEDGIVNKSDIDEMILNSLEEDARSGNYDFFSGIVGKGLYFLKTKNYSALTRVVEVLEEISCTDSAGTYWVDVNEANERRDEELVNLGSAHGMPSIINLLIFMYQEQVAQDRLQPLIDNSIKWMLSVATVRNGTYYFPYFFDRLVSVRSSQVLPGRLAWCYGDLGIAHTLTLAGLTFKNDYYYSTGLSIALEMHKRTELDECRIVDGSICHGTAGVAALYRSLYKLTGRQEFSTSERYWYKQSIELLCHEDGIGGYKYWTKNDDDQVGKFENSTGFLEGSAGVGLSLITHDYPAILLMTEWNRLLLLY